MNGESLSNDAGPFVPCAKGEHGGELVLIPPLALSKLHTSVKERGARGAIAGVVVVGGAGQERGKSEARGEKATEEAGGAGTAA